MPEAPAGTEPRSRASRAFALVARAGRIEKIIYRNLGLALRRRPDVPADGKGFHFHAPVLTILWIFIGLSAVELVILDLIVNRWFVVRVICLAVSIWGLVWMFGLLCGYYMRPHAVSGRGIEIRNGLDLDIRFPWDDVRSVAVRKHTFESKERILDVDGSAFLVLPILTETNIEITLEGPRPVTLPGEPPKGGRHTVSTVCIWTDDPQGFLDEVRRHL
ncbi:hypothetical protein [Leucobacter sp. USHLN153]|uniref:hypothetical protein n=1 Tax=Leucobacter sp. USHLN153 TaxID=3081268 RepID=UPI003016B609